MAFRIVIEGKVSGLYVSWEVVEEGLLVDELFPQMILKPGNSESWCLVGVNQVLVLELRQFFSLNFEPPVVLSKEVLMAEISLLLFLIFVGSCPCIAFFLFHC